MTTFKTKSDKIYKKDDRTTLDEKYNTKIAEFEEKKSRLPKMERKLEKYKRDLRRLNKKKNEENGDGVSSCSSGNIYGKIFDVKRNIKQLEGEIQDIKSNKNIADYYLISHEILRKYYTKKNINSSLDLTKKQKQQKQQEKQKQNTISKFLENNKKEVPVSNTNKEDKRWWNKFKINKDTFSGNASNKLKKRSYNSNGTIKISNFLETTEKFNKAELLNEYMKKVEPDKYIRKTYNNDHIFCTNCESEKIQLHTNGSTICNNCGMQSEIIIDNDKQCYKDIATEVSYFAYKRINHFNEWLVQCQAKESTDIPQKIIDDIKMEIKKERITPERLKKIKPAKIRGYLKKLKYNKYYEHIPNIMYQITGIPPPKITQEIEKKLRIMFTNIQAPFIEVCPKDRSNFLSYSYVLHKFVELIGLTEYKKLFPLLKSREKLQIQDQIWKKICKKVNWDFYPSI